MSLNHQATAPKEHRALSIRVFLRLPVVTFSFSSMLLSGCMSLQLKPPTTTVATIRTVAILPLEPLPLGLVGKKFGQPPLSDILKSAVPLTSGPLKPPQIEVGVLGGILLAVELTNAGRATPGEFPRLEDFFSTPGAWLPTVILADEAASQIAQEGVREVSVVKKFYRLPIRDRNPSWHLENWFAFLRRWYNEDSATLDYAELDPGPVDAVLEVGLDYAIVTFSGFLGPHDQFFMQVFLKLIDPNTKRVLGRARYLSNLRIRSVEELFAREGGPFKELFSDTGRDLVAKGLQDLGLVPESLPSAEKPAAGARP